MKKLWFLLVLSIVYLTTTDKAFAMQTKLTFSNAKKTPISITPDAMIGKIVDTLKNAGSIYATEYTEDALFNKDTIYTRGNVLVGFTQTGAAPFLEAIKKSNLKQQFCEKLVSMILTEIKSQRWVVAIKNFGTFLTGLQTRNYSDVEITIEQKKTVFKNLVTAWKKAEEAALETKSLTSYVIFKQALMKALKMQTPEKKETSAQEKNNYLLQALNFLKEKLSSLANTLSK